MQDNINEKIKNLLTKKIKDTKYLKNLDYNFVYFRLNKYILTYGDVYKKLKADIIKKNNSNIEKNKYFKQIVKSVRDELRIIYGSFLTDEFLKLKNQQIKKQEELLELLKYHKSTKERYKYYEEIYEKIFNWYKPKKIADLGCGLNPLSYFIIKKQIKNIKYFASDISTEDMNFLQNIFNNFKIQAITKPYDLTTLEFLNDKDFNDCDLVFFFKTLDSLEYIKKNISKTILEKIKSKKIVVSFPTKSLIAKKGFRIERRNWLFNYLNKKEYSYETFEVDNELFILITKNN